MLHSVGGESTIHSAVNPMLPKQGSLESIPLGASFCLGGAEAHLRQMQVSVLVRDRSMVEGVVKAVTSSDGEFSVAMHEVGGCPIY